MPLFTTLTSFISSLSSLSFLSFFFLIYAFSCSVLSQDVPLIYWNNDSLFPNDTIVLFGAGFTPANYINFCNVGGENCKHLEPFDVYDYSLKFLVPYYYSPNAYDFFVCSYSTGKCTSVISVNSPEPWFVIGDKGNFTSNSNGWFKIFGRSLSFDSFGNCVGTHAPQFDTDTIVTLQLQDNPSYQVQIKVVYGSCQEVTAWVPAGTKLGSYNILIQNRYTTIPVTKEKDGTPLVITIDSPPQSPNIIYDVRMAFGGNVSAAVQAANNNGGGLVYISKGEPIEMGDREVITLLDGTSLYGDGPDLSVLSWNSNTISPLSALILINGSSEIFNLTILAFSPASGGIFHAQKSSHDVNIHDITANIFNPSVMIGNVVLSEGTNIIVQNNFFAHGGNCSNPWPRNCAFWILDTSYNIFRNNTLIDGCQDYSGYGVDHTVILENTVRSYGMEVSAGNGLSTLGARQYLNKNAVIRNHQTGNIYAKQQYEAFTTDGGGGSYYGGVTNESTSSVLKLNSAAVNTQFDFKMVVVVLGNGTGQIAEIASMPDNKTVNLVTPLLISLDSSSNISIIGLRSYLIVSGNTVVNGTIFQIYGGMFYSLFSDNSLNNMTANKFIPLAGINIIGLDYYGGIMINCYSEIIRNNLTQSGGFHIESRRPDGMTGSYNRAMTFKNNKMFSELIQPIWLSGPSTDIIIENNIIVNSSLSPITIDDRCEHIVVRENIIK